MLVDNTLVELARLQYQKNDAFKILVDKLLSQSSIIPPDRNDILALRKLFSLQVISGSPLAKCLLDAYQAFQDSQ